MTEQAEAPKGAVPEDANERKHLTELHTLSKGVSYHNFERACSCLPTCRSMRNPSHASNIPPLLMTSSVGIPCHSRTYVAPMQTALGQRARRPAKLQAATAVPIKKLAPAGRRASTQAGSPPPGAAHTMRHTCF